MSGLRVLEDKEVGEMWRERRLYPFDRVERLIHKPVEERASVYWYIGNSREQSHEMARRDFGIDPSEL